MVLQRKSCIGCSLLFLLCLFLPLHMEAAPSFPPVQTHSFYAEDYAGVIPGETKQRINTIGRALEAQTKAQVVAVIMPEVPDGDMDTYANQLFRERKLGDSQMNNGILLLVSMKDKKARIEVGYGLEGALNDAKAGRILDQYLIPSFQKGQYGEGVAAAYTALVQVTMQEYGIQQLTISQGGYLSAGQNSSSWMDFLTSWEGLLLLGVIAAAVAADFFFFGGVLTHSVLQMVLLLLISRGGGGGFGGRGRGGSSGGGGAGRGW